MVNPNSLVNKGSKSYSAIQWIRKNCCLHPDHDLVNAFLYLDSVGLESALKLLETVRIEQGEGNTCKTCKTAEFKTLSINIFLL